MNARTGAAQPVPRDLVGDEAGTHAPHGPPVRSAQPVAPAQPPERVAPPEPVAPAQPVVLGAPAAAPGATGRAALVPGQAQGPKSGPRTGVAAGEHGVREDAARTADASAIGNLLRCWVRERDIPEPPDGAALVLPMEATGLTLRVPVRYWSPTGRHDFGPPVVEGAAGGGVGSGSADTAAGAGAAGVSTGAGTAASAPLDAVTLAALVAREAAHLGSGAAAPADAADLVARVADSVRRTAQFLAERGASPQPPPGVGPFLDAEQALVLGHPLHPAPTSRQGLTDDECRAYSPEVRAAFPLHWIAVDESVLACDSAWTERGRAVGAAQLAARLAGDALTARLPARTVPLPLHPWQARRLSHRPAVARLFADGLLHDLGEAGDVWHPTSSVRTVARPGGPAMLKLSLGLPITNSRRENLRKELLRGLEVHRLLRSGLGAQWRAVHPGFDIVRDPAWLGVDGPDGRPLPGLDTVVRHNPFGPSDDAVCVAGLIAEHPRPGAGPGALPTLRSRLAEIVEGLAARTDRPLTTVATEWFLRYLDAVVEPVLWLDAHAGIALEAHQQNTLVLLDGDGWPAGGRYRDNQGYYFRESRREALQQRLPGARPGTGSDSFVDDAVADERFAYYLGINNLLGLIGAFGVQRLADERVLLAAARQFLRRSTRGHGRSGDGGPVSALPELLLQSPTLRCKANLLTRLHGMDELVGPVDTQSVYVTVTNPLCP